MKTMIALLFAAALAVIPVHAERPTAGTLPFTGYRDGINVVGTYLNEAQLEAMGLSPLAGFTSVLKISVLPDNPAATLSKIQVTYTNPSGQSQTGSGYYESIGYGRDGQRDSVAEIWNIEPAHITSVQVSPGIAGQAVIISPPAQISVQPFMQYPGCRARPAYSSGLTVTQNFQSNTRRPTRSSARSWPLKPKT